MSVVPELPVPYVGPLVPRELMGQCLDELWRYGVRARVLVLCDHERASATVPVDLAGVMDAEAGSAIAALETLLTDPDTAVLHPMLVTGSVVAASVVTVSVAVVVDGVATVLHREGDPTTTMQPTLQDNCTAVLISVHLLADL